MQVDLSINALQTQESCAENKPLAIWRIFSVIYFTAFSIALLDFADARSFLGDIDDRMRELQIRQFFSANGRWYDLTLPMIAMPETYASPWSRLIDLPYITIAAILAPLLGLEKSIPISFDIWPPVMLSIFSILVAAIFRPQLRASRALNYTIVVTSVFLMILAVWEFVPGRIDHHNMQIIGLLMMMAGLQRWDRAGGILVGAGTLICFVVSLEGLPFVALGFLGLVLCFVFDVRGTRQVLFAAAVTILVLTLPAAFAFIGPSGILSMQCDAFSAPYILLAIGCSLSLAAGTALLAKQTFNMKLIGLALPTAFVAAATAILFPRCLSGPYWMIDPLSRADWLDRVGQEQSFVYFLQQGQFFIVFMLAVLACIAIMALPAVIGGARKQHAGIAIMFAVAVASLVLTLLQTRNIRFAFAFIPLFLPLALELVTMSAAEASGRLKQVRTLVAAAVILVLGTTVVLRFTIPLQESHYDAIDYMAYSDCANQDFSVLSSQQPGRIAVPQGLALPVVFAAPDGFSVAVVPFHRASPGMKRMFEAFTSHASEVRHSALAPFDYVAVCRFPLSVDPHEAPLYAELARGGSWPGLQRIPSPSKTDFQLFRINHSSLR
ncbi:hypothetical protein [Rhizobium leguminosarum]|uniref:hypothetical protein n=1 Tax=Rhizobium leguminosarum TaxID=384 RepID=UPI003F9E87EC